MNLLNSNLLMYVRACLCCETYFSFSDAQASFELTNSCNMAQGDKTVESMKNGETILKFLAYIQ